MFQTAEDRLELVQNLYVANVRNRLRELETPDTDLKKRWIWELIQNAKDCSKEAACFIKNTDKLPFTRKNQTVDIKIQYDKSKKMVVFMHNGFPFTNRTLDSLMYKNSTKESEDDNTGRFGTGFMTSHTLSRVVPINAPFLSYVNKKWELSYISAIVYREGSSDKQLKQEFLKMEKSKKCYKYDQNNEMHKWTIFQYQLTNDIGFQSAELGIQSFRDNIMEVLLFCEEINSIQLNNEDPIFSSAVSKNNNLTQTLVKQNIFTNIQVVEKVIVYSKQRTFIVATVDDPNVEYSKKYSKDHDKDYSEKRLKCSIAFEIDSNRNIVDLKKDKICLFCTFPLIGSENYQFPFVLNSPHFETFTERNGIILEGDEFNSNKILTNSGLNFLIINTSIELFKIILQWLIQYDYTNFASFSNGLIFNDKTLPQMKPFLNNFREILENSKIIHNSENVKTVFKQTFILNFNKVKDPKTFHNLASEFYSNVASFEECQQWQNKTWSSISILNVESFVDHIQKVSQNTQNSSSSFKFSCKLFKQGLDSLQSNDFIFLNTLYTFLLKEESENSITANSIFSKYQIVLNSSNQLTSIQFLKSNSNCSKDFNKIMELCPSWRNKIIHPQISCFNSLIPKVSIDDAISEIKSNLDKKRDDIQFLLSFIRYSLNGNEHRNKMYRVAKLFYNAPKQINVTDVDEKIWQKIDSQFLTKINDEINKDKGKKFTKSLEDLNIFYELYQKFHFNNSFLVPNTNLELIDKNQLGFISADIDPVLLEALGPFINLTQFAHPSITSVNFRKVYNLDSLIQTVNSTDFYIDNGDFLDNHFFTVLSIIPPESNERLYNFQTNIRELAKFFSFPDIKMIKASIINELFWKKANEIFIDGMANILLTQGNVTNLAKSLNQTEETVFNYLNLYYEVLKIDDNPNRQKKAIIPNYKGSFIQAENLFLSNGISDELFDLYNAIHPESDIREKFAHPKVNCNFLSIIDFKQFISSICDGVSDDQLINDSRILQAISNLNISKNSDSSQAENEILLQKLYVANIKNRLNEIKNPTENDKIRWPWELIQNAKDSLYASSNLDNQKEIEISIQIKINPKTKKYTEVKFCHNGPPFTENSFIGLLYKISQEKNNSETTGRFGTGFISTHVLSKVVQIKGNKIDKEGKISGFTATLYREGLNDPDIINDFKAMQQSQKKNLSPFTHTEFTYKIKSEESRECVKLGLQHFKDHIAAALINCPEIKFIVIFENDNHTKYSMSKMIQNKINNTSYYICDCYENSRLYKKFIVLSNEEHKTNISVEINEQNKIVPIKKNMESISIVFPLVGSKLHSLPFYLNSSKFEPSTERNALILNGKETIEGSLTNTGKNRFLLMKSIDLYKDMIDILNSIPCSNIFELSRGLVLTKEPYPSFDMDWYQKNFLKSMKEILSNNVYVYTEQGEKVLLKDAYFPSKKIDKNIFPQFITLANRYCKNIVCLNDAIIWRDRIWDELSIVEIEDLIHDVEKDESLFEDPTLAYLNDFLGFIWCIDRNILYDYKLIPDMNNKLHSLSKEKEKFDMKESKTVQGQIIDIMESIEIKWRSTHMNDQISSISLPEDKIIDAESRIIEKIKENNEMSFEMMKFVQNGVDFRQYMFYFVTGLNIRDYTAIIVNDINPSIWEFADNYVLSQIVTMISDFQPEKVKSLIEYFKVFLPFYQTYQKDEEFLNSTKIFPNANFVLHKKTELKNKNESFHDYLNPTMIEYFEKDLNDDIMHPEINKFIKVKSTESINDILAIINNKIDQLEKEKQLIVAEKVLCLIPHNEAKQSKQMLLFYLYQALIKDDLIHIPISAYGFESRLEKSNNIIIQHVCSKIEETNTLDNFIKTFSINDENLCFNILNTMFSFASNYLDDFKIIPDQKGEFRLKKDLKEDPGIEDDLLECISYFKIDSISKYNFADKRVKVNLDKIKVLQFYKDLISMFTEALGKEKVDYKVFELIKKINNINDNFFDIVSSPKMTEDQKARIKILKNAHIQYIQNKLKDLKSPNIADYKRWPFELIQNANNTLLSSKEKRQINIWFEFRDKSVIFRHNGLPFTNDSLFSLLYQCSDSKKDDAGQASKFGSGFLSTHILSKEINLSGDVQTQNGISGFSVSMYRDGSTPEKLYEGVVKMEESLEKNQEIKNLTTFEFILKDTNSKQASVEGHKSLVANIGPLLIFNPTIESITIITKTRKNEYRASHEEGNIQTITITNKSNKQEIFNRFILCNSKPNYKEKTIFDITCLLQINNQNEIQKITAESLFTSYPMFLKKSFYSPFIISSPNFEHNGKNRNRIKLESKEGSNENEEFLINKFIFTKSADLFEQMISIAISLNCTKFYNIYSRLHCIAGTEYLKEDFYNKMEKVLFTFPVFETSQGMRKMEEVNMPFIEKYEDFILEKDEKTQKEKDLTSAQKKELYDEFYHLVSQLSANTKFLVEYESCLEWNNGLHLHQTHSLFTSKLTINDFISLIQNYQKVSDLLLTDNDEIEAKILFIRNVIIYIKKFNDHKDIFKYNKILLDEKGRFVSSGDLYYFNVQPIFIEMLDVVNFNYREKKIHHEIEDLFDINSQILKIFELKEAIKEIIDNTNNENAVFLMKYIIKGDEKRKQMFKYTQFFINESIQSVELPEVDQKEYNIKGMFSNADEYIFDQLIEKVQTYDIQKNLQFFMEFFKFMREIASYGDFNSTKIFPNQKYKLCTAYELNIDDINDENFKIVLENALKIDLRSRLLLKEFAEMILLEHLKITDISYMIIESPEFPNLHKIDKSFRHQFYSIIFQYSEINEKVKQIVGILNFFLKAGLKLPESSNGKLSSELTNKVIEVAIKEIIEFISKFSTFSDLSSSIEKDQQKQSNILTSSIYDNLSLFYNFSTEGKIFPNRMKEFVELEEISWLHDPTINNEDMEKLFEYLILFSESDEIKGKVLDESINVCEPLQKVIKISDLKWLSTELMQFVNQKDKKLFNQFLMYIRSSKELKNAFAPLLKSKYEEEFDQFLTYLINLEDEKEISYTGQALVYEVLLNSKKFSVVKWSAKSDAKTNFQITLGNGHKYFINEKDDHYDIYAEDLKKKKFFFKIKSTKDVEDDDKKFSFAVSKAQFKFASDLSNKGSQFVLVLVKNVLQSPEYLFLTKQNEIFTL
ncbi:hypothetical protein M9Y10_031127 [Tritrichomonas musculus]|uniref:Protein NO VEIN C-terminal domain-containing protein n=1 Tax=Tritrichomonas musculus TaxID=1915356 RepID=A0ABR2H2U8_9EUKA